MELHLASMYEAIADEIGDATALVHGTRRRRWSELDDRAARLSAAFGAFGLKPGSVVAIDLYNCPEFIEVFLAAIKGGFVPTMVNYRYRADELRFLLADSGAELVVANQDLAPAVRSVSGDLPDLHELVVVGDGYDDLIAASDPAPRRKREGAGSVLSYTGGTTGLPKGVVYELSRLSAQAVATRWLAADIESGAPVLGTVRELYQRGELPAICPASPLMHSTAFTFATLPALCAGGSVVTLEHHRFDPEVFLDACGQHRVTVTAVVGDAFARPMVAALDERAAAGRPLGAETLRSMCSAGVAFSADTKQRLLEHLPQLTILDACGATEGAHYGTSIVRAGDDATTATFQPSEGTIIVDAERRRLPDGDVGYISARRVTTGYHNHPELTAATFYEDDEGEWRVVPGDFGRIEPDGSLTLLGRGTSVINTGGEKVYPEEVESVIKTLPGIVDAIVWAVPDERLGSVVGAVVTKLGESTIDAQTVHEHVRARLAGYKAPRRTVFADHIPRHANGKLDVAGVGELLRES